MHTCHPGRIRLYWAFGMNLAVAETATNKPADQDFTAQLTKLRAADCDLIAMGAIVRDAKTGVLSAGADPRRPAYALGW